MSTMEEKKFLNIYLVSDCTGDTLSSVSRAVMDRFSNVEYEEYIFSLVRTEGQVDKIFSKIKRPAVVMYTIVDESVRTHLKKLCKENNIEYVPVLSPIISKISSLLGMKTNDIIGKRFALDEEYFSWIEAVNYALSHDDGNLMDDLEEADIVLVGVSRTSKSPTTIYLAYRGYKTANVPYVMNSSLNEKLPKLKKPFIVGLTISVDRLIEIRKNRLMSLNDYHNNDYVNIETVSHEIEEARKFFLQNRWPIIDVSRKSVEETATKIIQLYQERQLSKGN
ncbi:MAG: kinase/pyrophosphorylase [Sphingobacteriia bacterium]|nr:kinase/pyrophosphorylase [Sphingobacteriia bacterium]